VAREAQLVLPEPTPRKRLLLPGRA
jgi:hypothetical protein